MFSSGVLNLFLKGNPGLSVNCIVPGISSQITTDTINLILWNTASGTSMNLVTVGAGTKAGSVLATHQADCICQMPEYGMVNCTLYGPTITYSGAMNLYTLSTIQSTGVINCYNQGNGVSTRNIPMTTTGF